MAFKNIRNFHERVNTIFHLALAVPLLPMGYIYLEMNHNDWHPSMQNSTMVYASSLISALLVAAFVFTHYRGNLERVRELPTLEEKFNALFREYRKFYLGILLANLLLAMGYYLTGWNVLIGCYVFLLFGLSLWRPYYERYCRDLQLDDETAKKVRKLSLSFESNEEQA